MFISFDISPMSVDTIYFIDMHSMTALKYQCKTSITKFNFLNDPKLSPEIEGS